MPSPAAAVLSGYTVVGRALVRESGHVLAAVLVRRPVTAARLRLVGTPARLRSAPPQRVAR